MGLQAIIIDWIVQAISDSFNAPIVFSHNDLLSGNFMFNEDEGAITSRGQEAFHFDVVVRAGIIFLVYRFFNSFR